MLLSLMIYLVQVTWRFSDLDRLASVLDFILDGLEESIRDILEFLLEEQEEDGEKKFVARHIERQQSTQSEGKSYILPQYAGRLNQNLFQ